VGIDGGYSGFDDINRIIEQEFTIEEGLVEYDLPTFYVKPRNDAKVSFLRVVEKLEPKGYVPFMRERNGRLTIHVSRSESKKSGRSIISLVLFLATVGTTLYSGYWLSLINNYDPYLGAVTFSLAIMSVMGLHEMGHKLAARKYRVKATNPYFIPGPPPIGTFGAVIRQESLYPNRDALFDLGASGPILGFIVTLAVTVLGIMMSYVGPASPDGSYLKVPMLFIYIEGLVFNPNQNPILFFAEAASIFILQFTSPPSPTGLALYVHPVAWAGYVGMLVTVLNLMPAGMLDGGHVAFSILGYKVSRVIGILAIIGLFLAGFWLMALFALFLFMMRHPDPLDNVSKLSSKKKAFSIVLIAIFILCFTPLPLF